MSGTIPLSMTQQLDIYGKPLAGGQLYLMVAGTVSTPQDGFQDPGLTIKMPYPITLDAAGRIPQFFLADGLIKVRLQDKFGVVQLASDNIQVIGPSSGGGGGGGASVDPTQLIQTANVIFRYGSGLLAGYVRLNGLTIGSSTSGATERANADCQALFQYLWNDASLVVPGGRGASPFADWAANKQLTLPDCRGRSPCAADDMGNSAAGRVTFAIGGIDGTKVGAAGGLQGGYLGASQLPNIAPVFSGAPATISVATSGAHLVKGNIAGPQTAQSGGGTGAATGTGFNDGDISMSTPYTPGGAISSINGNVTQTLLVLMQPTMVFTFYMKL